MKRFLTSTAAALVFSTAAYADGHSKTFSDAIFDQAANLNASEIIGMRVYATEADIAAETKVMADGEKEWDDIGEINEIVLTRSGDVQSVIVGVGGFIGIGEKDVSINMSELKFVSDGEDADEFFLVVNASVADVEAAPSYENPMMENRAALQDDMRPILTAPTIERDGYETVTFKDLTAEDLTGARVYGPKDEDVGEISELLVTTAGELDRAVIDVGGFLGMGEHTVAVEMSALEIVRATDNSDLRVYIDSTQETLEKQPEYNG